jgi:hypothetical protein
VITDVGKPIHSDDDENGGSRYSQVFSPGQNTTKVELDAARFRNLGPMVNDYRDNIHQPQRRLKDNTRQFNLSPVHTWWKLGGEITSNHKQSQVICQVKNHTWVRQ